MFDTGTTGFMLLATSLVMLMTPGLAFFYGGLAGKRNILGIMIQSFVSMGITTILWFICGYSLCFSGDALGGIIGNLDKAFMQGVDLNSPFPGNHLISHENKFRKFVISGKWRIQINTVHKCFIKITNYPSHCVTTETERVTANKPQNGGDTH